MGSRANSLASQGDLAEAISLYREAVEFARTAFGEDHPDVLMLSNNLAAALARPIVEKEPAHLTIGCCLRAMMRRVPF